MIQANQAYTVQLQVQVGQLLGTIRDASITAISNAKSDPTFALGDGIANPGAYSFTFSPGIGNTPLPEPSALVMLPLAVGSLLARRRHRPR